MSQPEHEQFPTFEHIDLRLVAPEYDSELTDLIMELESLRTLRISGTTPRTTFFQIKSIFHILESICSARIEGNRTTAIEYIDKKLERNPDQPDSFKEIENMEQCLDFIDENIKDTPINRAFISELHKRTVNGLADEGSISPGEYRKCQVHIRNSDLVPPPFIKVPEYMEELLGFIANEDAHKYDLIKVALAHHRFVWIHPFDNGNGRTVRLLTYAMMVKLGFNIHLSRVMNPAAVFCNDRGGYYSALAKADKGDDGSLLGWVLYMLSGLLKEFEKTDKLSNYEYLRRTILYPAVDYSLEKNIINPLEAKILSLAIEKPEIMNADIKALLPDRSISDVSRIIRKLLNKRYLAPTITHQRIYTINFNDNALLRGIIFSLGKEGFIPDKRQ